MIFYFLVAVGGTLLITFTVKKIAVALGIVDKPDGKRKRHAYPVPLWGGLALFVCWWLMIGYVAWYDPLVFSGHITTKHLIGIFLGSLLILVLGLLDDRKSLSPSVRFVGSVVAVIVGVISGIQLTEVTNPWGGVFRLEPLALTIPWVSFIITLGDVIVFLWLLGMVYTTKILDGLDGLTTGIVAIGALMIFFLTQTPRFYQPDVGLLAVILAGICLGFLLLNFYPAKIFLGESGSMLLGYWLGILAVISGGKIATALLVMAVPILDIIRVVYMRITRHHKVFEGDREHLHFRLLDAGFSQRKTVLFLYTISFIFGFTTLFFQSSTKLIVLLGLGVVMLFVGAWLSHKKNTYDIT
jgi:UDP-GlcNAc:undecaprenyl-phosphate GlcNAc-1-phosphate transferase